MTGTLFNPIKLSKWIDENRDVLKPPVGNKMVWKDREFIVMVIGGPNIREDYHVNAGEEFFYQIEGDIVLKVKHADGRFEDIQINEGDMYLLPANLAHSPQRPAGSIGMVIERKRREGEDDELFWHCQKCGDIIYSTKFHLTDIENQLPNEFNKFFNSDEHTTCNSCGAKYIPPKKG
jgi:3-hydroxyanthranilate 3,4-dioxygenase